MPDIARNAPPDRRQLWTVALTLAAALTAVATFTGIVDPYGRFNGKPAVVAVHGAFTNAPLLGLVELRRLPQTDTRSAEVVLAGDSRARFLTEKRSATAEDKAVVNLGVPGGSFEESLAMVEVLAPELKKATLLIISTPLERLTDRPRPNRCWEAKPVADSRLRYLLNWNMCQESLAIVRAEKVERPAAHAALTAEQMKLRDDRTAGTWAEMFRSYDEGLLESRLKLLHRTVSPLTARGVKVVFWSPPIQPRIQAFVTEYHLESVWERVVAELAKDGRVADLSKVTSLSGTELVWGDPVHTRNHELVLQWLIRYGAADHATGF